MGNGCSCNRVHVQTREKTSITFEAVVIEIDKYELVASNAHFTTNGWTSPTDICEGFSVTEKSNADANLTVNESPTGVCEMPTANPKGTP